MIFQSLEKVSRPIPSLSSIRRMKVLLINPPFLRLQEIRRPYFPLGLGYLAAALREAGHEAGIYNAEMGAETWRLPAIVNNRQLLYAHAKYTRAVRDDNHPIWTEIDSEIRAFQPDVLGITTITPTVSAVIRIARLCKAWNPGCPVVLGGIHPTVLPEKTVQNADVDYVVIGEGDRTIVELVARLATGRRDVDDIPGLAFKKNGGAALSATRELVADVNELPRPARDLLLHPELYSPKELGALATSRGCPFRCAFCEAKRIWTRKVRFRDPERVLDELQDIINTYGTRNFSINDDSFTTNRRHVTAFCEGILKRGLQTTWACQSRVDLVNDDLLALMRRAGCVSLSFGIESGSERVLKHIHKDITIAEAFRARDLVRKHDMKFTTNFIVGFPFETADDIRETLRVIKELAPDFVNLCTFAPFPGSELHEECRQQGLVNDQLDWDEISNHSVLNRFAVLVPPREYERLLTEIIGVSDRFNNSPLRRLRTAWRKWGWRILAPKGFGMPRRQPAPESCP